MCVKQGNSEAYKQLTKKGRGSDRKRKKQRKKEEGKKERRLANPTANSHYRVCSELS